MEDVTWQSYSGKLSYIGGLLANLFQVRDTFKKLKVNIYMLNQLGVPLIFV